MSTVYRSVRIDVTDANQWFYKTLYLDKKIGIIRKVGITTVALRNEFRVIIPGFTLSHQIALYNGTETLWDNEAIGLAYSNEDNINGVNSFNLCELNGEEGILNSYGYLKAGIRFADVPLLSNLGVYGMKTKNYLLFAPWYEVRDPTKLPDPLLNPVVFKYPYQMEFRFECEI